MVFAERFGRNFPKKFTITKAHKTPFLSLGGSISRRASTLAGSGSTPFADNLSPKNVISVTPKNNFLFSFKSCAQILSISLNSC